MASHAHNLSYNKDDSIIDNTMVLTGIPGKIEMERSATKLKFIESMIDKETINANATQ